MHFLAYNLPYIAMQYSNMTLNKLERAQACYYTQYVVPFSFCFQITICVPERCLFKTKCNLISVVCNISRFVLEGTRFRIFAKNIYNTLGIKITFEPNCMHLSWNELYLQGGHWCTKIDLPLDQRHLKCSLTPQPHPKNICACFLQYKDLFVGQL